MRRPECWSFVAALIATAIAGYLTLVHYRESLLVCSGVSDCQTVQNSKYAEMGGIPIALLGLILFAILLGLTIARLARPDIADALTAMIFVSAAGAVAFYAYLTWLELFVIDAICQWCVASALATLALLISESVMVRRVLLPDDH
jgi:uncharacterized membrane protein